MDFSLFFSLLQNEDCLIDYIIKSDRERNNLCSFFSSRTVERVKRKERQGQYLKKQTGGKPVTASGV